jgi:WhiB family transcriptional regulator, redox-sensing transcriptional regulator
MKSNLTERPNQLQGPARNHGRLPCQQESPHLWFSQLPAELNLAKLFCRDCPRRQPCLAGAIERAEPIGVWGGEIFDQGRIIDHKRPRGRPRKGTSGGDYR